jgi:hypothetical protein
MAALCETLGNQQASIAAAVSDIYPDGIQFNLSLTDILF